MKKLLLLSVVVTLGFSGCNKTKTYSKRLSGETWSVVKLTINGEDETDHLPQLTFSDCDICAEVCTGEWMLEGEHAEFAWQFDEKGQKFTVSNQSEATHEHEHEEGHVEPIDQCQDLSGSYDVVKMTRKTMQLSSSTTVGYHGTEVEMELEKD